MEWIRTILALFLMALPSSSEENVTTLAIPNFAGPENLVCLLRKQPHEVCKERVSDDKIPLRLKQLYARMSEELKKYVQQGSFAKIPPEIFSELSPVIFYSMPNGDDRLGAGDQALARIVRSLGGDSAAIVASAKLLHSPEQRESFIAQLSGVNLPEKSQKVLGEFLAEWFVEGNSDWKFERFSKTLKAGNPLVGSLPPPFLTSLAGITTERFLFLLSRWESRKLPREEQWYSKGKVVARTWSSMIIKASYPHPLSEWTTTSFKRYPFLLIGFTPDELSKMAEPHKDVRADLLKNKFEKLQARAVFEVIMKKIGATKSLNKENGISLLTVPILTMLSPHQLSHYFKHSIADFGVLKNLSGKSSVEPSFATARQLAHCLIAQSKFKRLKNLSSTTVGGRNKRQTDIKLSQESSVSNVSSNQESAQSGSDSVVAKVNGRKDSSTLNISFNQGEIQNGSAKGLTNESNSMESSLEKVSLDQESLQSGKDQGLSGANESVNTTPIISSIKESIIPESNKGVSNETTGKLEPSVSVNQSLQNASDGPLNQNSSMQSFNAMQLSVNDLINAGNFVYSLSLPYFTNNHLREIPSWQFGLMDSRNIRPRQGRLLTKYLKLQLEAGTVSHEGENVNKSLHVTADELLGFGPGLLRGILPTTVITNIDLRKIPQRAIKHILSTDIPWSFGNTQEDIKSLRSLAILQKIRNDIDQDWVLKSILSNGESAQLLKYLYPQELISISQTVLKSTSFNTLLQLHHKTSTALLDIALPELISRGPGEGKWASESLAVGALPLLRGLSCHHLTLLDYHDVVVVLGQSNKQRQARSTAKYQPFPKDLQYCALEALYSHLKAKASLWYEKEEENLSSEEILSVLEDTDVESIGGFIIAGLPMGILQQLHADAVRTIGQLSSHELLSALYGNHNPSDVAILLLKKLGLEASNVTERVQSNEKELHKESGRLREKWKEWYKHEPSLLPFLFGSLLVYLPPDKVDALSLKWALETATPGENLACLNAKTRETLYLKLKDAFGEPESWTSSTLSIIGDFLITVPKERLPKIPSTSWEGAADSLIEKSRLFHRIIRMTTGVENYVQVCMKFLEKPEQDAFMDAAKTIARYYLLASQLQMNGVSLYSDILKSSFLNSSSQKEEFNVNSTGIKWIMDQKITCETIQAVGQEISKAALKSEDIDLMSPSELWDCVDILGSIDLDEEVLKKVWMQIKNRSQELELQDLGKVARILSNEDLMKFNVSISSNLDDLYTLGRHLPDWNKINLKENKILPDLDRALTTEEVAALGGLICGLTDTSGNKMLNPQVILQAAPLIAEAFRSLRYLGCPPKQCIETLGKLVASGLGDPVDGWSAMELETVDILAAGFSEDIWKSLKRKNNILRGLQVSAIECMPTEILKSFNASQVNQLPPPAAIRLSVGKYNISESQWSEINKHFESTVNSLDLEEEVNVTTPMTEPEESTPEDHDHQSDSKAVRLYYNMLYLLMAYSIIILR